MLLSSCLCGHGTIYCFQVDYQWQGLELLCVHSRTIVVITRTTVVFTRTTVVLTRTIVVIVSKEADVCILSTVNFNIYIYCGDH